MPDSTNISNAAGQNTVKPNRPLSLIEILVAEYEIQREMNPSWPKELVWPSTEKPTGGEVIRYNTDEIMARCLRIEAEAVERFESSTEQCEYINQKTDELVKGFYRALHANKDKVKRTALCFSGGGIRSATFGLGLLQGLVGRGVGLNEFHYVSTVSGGGYIGSWLSAWIHRQGIHRVQEQLSPLRARVKAADILSGSEPPVLPSDPEPETIEHLRRYSNYMSPKLGLLSADTWTLVGTFLRNLTLNWTVLLPLLLAVLAIPRLAVSIASWNCPRPQVETVVLIIAFIAGVISMAYLVANLPSWRGLSRLPERFKTEGRFLVCCWLMLVTSAFLSVFYWAWIHIPQHRTVALFGASLHPSIPFILFGLFYHVVGYLIARLFLIRLKSRGLFLEIYDFGVRAFTGVLGGGCLWLATMAFAPVPVEVAACGNPAIASSYTLTTAPTPSPSPIASVAEQMKQREEQAKKISIEAGLYTTFGPPVFLLMFLIAATIFVGVASTFTNDADREWLARAGGWMLIAIFGWAALCGLVIFGPVGLILAWQKFKLSLLSVSTVSGLLTLAGGFSSKSAASKKSQSSKNEAGILGQIFSLGLPVAAAIFTLIVLAALSLATSSLLANVQALLPGFLAGKYSVSEFYKVMAGTSGSQWWHLIVLYESPATLIWPVIGMIFGLGLLMGLFVNINKFSLHSAYRDRLIRAYLGASNNTRRPNPFTGFDDLDNVQMHNLLTEVFQPESFSRLLEFTRELKSNREVCEFICSRLSPSTQQMVSDCVQSRPINERDLKCALADDLNRIIESEDLWEQPGFLQASRDEKIRELINSQPDIPFLPFGWLPKKINQKKVYVQKLLINRKLIEKVFEGLINSPDQFRKVRRPLHIVNIALNLVGGKELAWQERKAQPFTVSALHAGSYGLGYRDVKEYAVSRQAKGALSLGTSLAISGAAVSPNMGYNSSSAVTFLLMLFNVRLGWWLGNPGTAGAETYTKPSPFFTPTPLIAETLGRTDSEHPYVYLSDGAHFENLALYEMIRRRCHYIFLSDAGADEEFNFDDLGNALRKIRIDLGVPIEFKWEMPIQSRVAAEKLFAADGKSAGKYCALARIKYSEVDGTAADDDGWLIYIKPTVYGIEPQDVQNYAKSNPTFPHETTGDQMYSESQFESYRALGEYVVRTIAGNGPVGDLDGLFDKVKTDFIGKPKPASIEKEVN